MKRVGKSHSSFNASSRPRFSTLKWDINLDSHVLATTAIYAKKIKIKIKIVPTAQFANFIMVDYASFVHIVHSTRIALSVRL